MPADLLQQCIAAHENRVDFPTVWRTLLSGHPLVAGLPIQMAGDGAVWLEIPLTTGHRLTHSHAGGYALLDQVTSVLRRL
jgi:hypothetical protein